MKPKQIVDKTFNYVLSRSNGNKEKLEYYLNYWKYKKPDSIEALYKSLLEHAKNRQRMSNSIGNISNLKELLFNFNPKKVYKNYQDWKELFITIEEDYSQLGRMDIENPKNYWVLYSKSILSGSKYLSQFNDITEFNDYASQFIHKENIDLRIAFPLLLKEELFGFGFALSCDFIKENISPEFIKPDIHIKDIFKEINICKEKDSDYDIFKKVIAFSNEVDKKPYWIDKLFWLVGKRKFYKTKKYPNTEKINTSKKELIKLLKN